MEENKNKNENNVSPGGSGGSCCYTISDLQKMLGASRGGVYALLRENKFFWFRIGNRYRIPKKSFDRWLNNE